MIDLRVAGRTALVTGVGSLVATLVAVFLSYPSHRAGVEIVLRTALVSVVLVLVLPSVVRDSYAHRRGSGLLSVLVGAIAGYAIDVASWVGRAYAGQLIHSPGFTTLVVDLVLWLLVVAVAVQVRLTEQRPARSRTSYLG